MHQEKQVAAIKQWLNTGADYAQGVKLYEAIGPSRVLKRRLLRGRNAYREKQLKDALLSIMRQLEQQQERPATSYAEPTSGSMDWQSLPPVLRKMKVELSEVFRYNQQDHYKLRQLETPEERFVVQQAMLEREKRRRQIWAYLDHWKDEGELHPDLVETVNDLGDRIRLRDFLRRYRNVPTYIIRARKASKEAKDEQAKAKATERLKAYQHEMEELNRLESFAWIVVAPMSETATDERKA